MLARTGEGIEQRSALFYGGVAALSQGKAQVIAKSIRSSRCGYELWRRLNREYEPTTGNRKLMLVSDLMEGAQFKDAGVNTFEEKLMAWEDGIKDYDKIAAHPFDDELKMVVLLN